MRKSGGMAEKSAFVYQLLGWVGGLVSRGLTYQYSTVAYIIRHSPGISRAGGGEGVYSCNIVFNFTCLYIWMLTVSFYLPQ